MVAWLAQTDRAWQGRSVEEQLDALARLYPQHSRERLRRYLEMRQARSELDAAMLAKIGQSEARVGKLVDLFLKAYP